MFSGSPNGSSRSPRKGGLIAVHSSGFTQVRRNRVIEMCAEGPVYADENLVLVTPVQISSFTNLQTMKTLVPTHSEGGHSFPGQPMPE